MNIGKYLEVILIGLVVVVGVTVVVVIVGDVVENKGELQRSLSQQLIARFLSLMPRRPNPN